MPNLSLKSEFGASADEVDAIFTSFRSLHSIYRDSISNLKQQLGYLPESYLSKVRNANTSFENMSRTVSNAQNEISSKLHSQGIVLLMGNAESILESAFSQLVIYNFRKIKIENNKSINFTLQEIVSSPKDIELGLLLIKKLEKISFQNVLQLEKVLRDYFDIRVGKDHITRLHEYWQIRHIIVHKQGNIDQQFLKNLNNLGIDTKKYKLHRKIVLNRQDYDDCSNLLSHLFEHLDNEMARLELDYSIPF